MSLAVRISREQSKATTCLTQGNSVNCQMGLGAIGTRRLMRLCTHADACIKAAALKQMRNMRRIALRLLDEWPIGTQLSCIIFSRWR